MFLLFSDPPPMVPLLRAFWSLFDGIWRVLKGSWGLLVEMDIDTVGSRMEDGSGTN